MQMDILNFGTDETAVRFTVDNQEATILMEACAALREAKFPGMLDKLPRMFDDEDVAKAVGNEEQANQLMGLLELEQTFHQSLHMFPGGHDHGHEGH